MARLPDHYVNEVNERVSMQDLAGFDTELKKKSGNTVWGCCPFHSEKTPSFKVNVARNSATCFGACGKSWRPINYVMEQRGLQFREAVDWLVKEFHLPEPPKEENSYDKEAMTKRAKMYSALEKAQLAYLRAFKKSEMAQKYLFEERKIDARTAELFGIGFAPDHWDYLKRRTVGRDFDPSILIEAGLVKNNEEKQRSYDLMRNRLMFPIRNVKGSIVAFGGRVFPGDESSKYINSPETELYKKGNVLFGLFESLSVKGSRSREMEIVEGNLDVVTAHQYGLTNHVGTCGTALTEAHCKLIFKYADKVTLVFDGDKAGREAAWKAVKTALPLISPNRTVHIAMLPDGEDVDSILHDQGADTYNSHLQKAQALSVYLFEELQRQFCIKTVEQRARFKVEAEALIETVEDGNVRDLLAFELQNRLGTAEATQKPDREKVAQYFRNIPVNAQATLRTIAPATLQCCATLAAKPELLAFLSEETDALPKHDAQLLRIVRNALSKAKENGARPEESQDQNFRYLFLYLKECAMGASDEAAVNKIVELNKAVAASKRLGKTKTAGPAARYSKPAA